GLPHMRYYDLRHSALSFMAAQGAPVDVARDIIGHSDARLTMNVYRHVLPEEHDRAAELLEGFFRGK
ncbi:MAG: tyrosine-type recombinase/integrase, partial [Thermomicrobiales bacterium]